MFRFRKLYYSLNKIIKMYFLAALAGVTMQIAFIVTNIKIP